MIDDKPRARWCRDRWVSADGRDLTIMPSQVTVYGGLARAAAAKHRWLSDMADDLHTHSMSGFISQEEKNEAARSAVEIRELSEHYHAWAMALVRQGL